MKTKQIFFYVLNISKVTNTFT